MTESSTEKPGDEAIPGTTGSGDNVCPECSGSGQLDGKDCTECAGTGIVQAAVGGA